MALVVAATLPRSAWDLAGLCRETTDWEAVIELARHHGVTALCHRALAAQPPGSVPKTVLARLGK